MGVTDYFLDSSDIASVIANEWKPPAASTEKVYELHLHQFLNQRFPNLRFDRQYRFAATTADLHIKFPGGGAAAIEVKKDLARRTELHRLVGQCYDYAVVWRVDVLVVLCGACEPGLLKIAKKATNLVATIGDRAGHCIHIPGN